jgi:hypothetical protein
LAVNVKAAVDSVIRLIGPDPIVTCGGTVSTVHDQVGGVTSVPPNASVARTVKACAPLDRFEYEIPDAQLANAAASRLHANVEPDLLLVKAKIADAWFVRLAGPELIVVRGGELSIVQPAETATLVFPAASVAWTLNACGPSARVE